MHNVWLRKIKIEKSFQGEGYGSSALKIFLTFIDALKIKTTLLQIDSDTPYAGNLYWKNGFKFIGTPRLAIKNWAKDSKNIDVENNAITEYLKDTTVKLKSNGEDVYMNMMRYNPNLK